MTPKTTKAPKTPQEIGEMIHKGLRNATYNLTRKQRLSVLHTLLQIEATMGGMGLEALYAAITQSIPPQIKPSHLVLLREMPCTNNATLGSRLGLDCRALHSCFQNLIARGVIQVTGKAMGTTRTVNSYDLTAAGHELLRRLDAAASEEGEP
jgi:hypothetical protein